MITINYHSNIKHLTHQTRLQTTKNHPSSNFSCIHYREKKFKYSKQDLSLNLLGNPLGKYIKSLTFQDSFVEGSIKRTRIDGAAFQALALNLTDLTELILVGFNRISSDIVGFHLNCTTYRNLLDPIGSYRKLALFIFEFHRKCCCISS